MMQSAFMLYTQEGTFPFKCFIILLNLEQTVLLQWVV